MKILFIDYSVPVINEDKIIPAAAHFVKRNRPHG